MHFEHIDSSQDRTNTNCMQQMDSKLELKSSTMSSDTGYLRESFSNNSYYSVSQRGKDDFKSYENSGAELKVSERNTGYADLNDIALNENQPYDNNVETPGQEEPDRKESQCRQCNCVISIVSAAVLVGCAIVLCLLLLCKFPGVKCIFPQNRQPPTTPPPPPPPVYQMRRGDSGYMHFTIYLAHATEIRLLKETVDGNDTLFTVGDLTNDTLVYVGNDQMNFSVSVNDAEIQATVYIHTVQCHLGGNYYVQAISDENGFKFISSELEVLSKCPCRYEFNIASIQSMRCSFPDAGNVSIMIEKITVDNPRILVNWSDIIRPIDIPNTNGFSASWLHSDTLVVEIRLGQIHCAHQGYYNINLTTNGTSQIYDIYVHVIDFPEEPLLAVLEGGIIEDKENGQISCEAFTGCTYTPLMLESKVNGIEEWTQHLKLSTKFELTDKGWDVQSLLNITKDNILTVDRKKFRCSYKANRKTIASNTICVRMIPANVCDNKTSGCQYQHPFFCNKFITCTSGPTERNCPSNLHFLYKGDCKKQCDWQTIEYMRNCNGYCDWPENVNCTENPANYCD